MMWYCVEISLLNMFPNWPDVARATPVTSELMLHELRLGVGQHCTELCWLGGSSDNADAADAVSAYFRIYLCYRGVRVMRYVSTLSPKKRG